MKWSNGLKKGFRYVLLSLCLLGVVFQPVTIFADTYSFTTYYDYNSTINGLLGYDALTQPFYYDEIGQTLLNSAISNYNGMFSTNITYQDFYSVYNATKFNSNKFLIEYFPLDNGIASLTIYSFVDNSLYIDTYNQNYYGFKYMLGYNTSVALYVEGEYSVSSGTRPANMGTIVLDGHQFIPFNVTYNGNSYVYVSGGQEPSGNITPNIPDIDINNPEGTTGGNYPLNIYFQLGMWLAMNYNSYTPDGSIHFNPTWVGVGQALTYDYLCKTNKDNAQVNITLSDGTELTLDNYLYGEPDYSSSLSTIQSSLNTISSRVETANTRLNTLNTSINTQMGAVNDKLNAAFPADQAAINDFIAEDVMDDTDGKGLTVSKIANTKSLLDEGVDTFEVDSTGITWTNPFSALLHLDWAWFSETTALNLQAQDQASLLNDIDYSGLQYYNSVNSYYNDGH